MRIGAIGTHAALAAVRIESSQFRAGDNGAGFVQHQRCRLQVAEETIVAGVDRVFVEDRARVRATPATVLVIGRGEQEVAT